LLAGLVITRFDAGRDGPNINFIGVVKNVAPRAIPFTYKLLRWVGTGWKLVESSSRTIQPKESMNLQTKLDVSNMPKVILNDALKFRLEINGGPNEQPSKEFSLPAKKTVFVVRYMTKNGGWACIFDETADVGADASSRELANKNAGIYQKFGFEAKIAVTKKVVLDPSQNDTYRVRAYVRAERELERTFDTEQEARDFDARIRRFDWVSRGVLFDVKISPQ
jgi:hypothetical protein